MEIKTDDLFDSEFAIRLIWMGKKNLQSCLLRIVNPQILKRLGRFLTTDFKSVGAPSGL